jgi:hypothetical protein
MNAEQVHLLGPIIIGGVHQKRASELLIPQYLAYFAIDRMGR